MQRTSRNREEMAHSLMILDMIGFYITISCILCIYTYTVCIIHILSMSVLLCCFLSLHVAR